jgi:hypothetical protein
VLPVEVMVHQLDLFYYVPTSFHFCCCCWLIKKRMEGVDISPIICNIYMLLGRVRKNEFSKAIH